MKTNMHIFGEEVTHADVSSYSRANVIYKKRSRLLRQLVIEIEGAEDIIISEDYINLK